MAPTIKNESPIAGRLSVKEIVAKTEQAIKLQQKEENSKQKL